MELNKKQLYLFNRLVLAQIWVFSLSSEGVETMPNICYRLKTAGFNSKAIHEFSDEEVECIRKLAMKPELKDISKHEVSTIINILVLAKTWVEDIPKENRPNINISDKKLILGRNKYLIDMLKLKKRDNIKYEEIRKIIDMSEENTKIWYNVAKQHIYETCHK